MALMLFLFIEWQGWSRWLVHALCLVLLAARALHAYGVAQEPEDIRLRATGMATTAGVLIVAAAPASVQRDPMTVDLARTPSFRLDGKRALVTGGGRGIGLAAASALAAGRRARDARGAHDGARSRRRRRRSARAAIRPTRWRST